MANKIYRITCTIELKWDSFHKRFGYCIRNIIHNQLHIMNNAHMGWTREEAQESLNRMNEVQRTQFHREYEATWK